MGTSYFPNSLSLRESGRLVRDKPRTLGERLDRLIGAFSPKWAASRSAWRIIREEFSYRAATARRYEQRIPDSGTPNFALERGNDRISMVFRARQQERDFVIADALLNRSVENVVGSGIVPQAKTRDREWNKLAENRFFKWADSECDARGLSSFWELQALTFRSLLRDGDCGVILLDDGKIQCIEADQIADPPGKKGTRDFIDGVQIDSRGRPIAYHIVDESDYAGGSVSIASRSAIVKRIVIPAESMLFLARRKRHGQTRGEPVFAQSFWLFEQLDGNIEAVTIASRMAACFGLVIKRAGGFGTGLPSMTSGENTYRKLSLEPGMIKELEPGDDISQIAPLQPTQNLTEFVTLICRLVGIPLGLPIELTMLDFSRTNFSSARASLLQAHRVFRAHQDYIKERLCTPLWNRLLPRWMESGELPFHEEWQNHQWNAPGWQWIDPRAEVESSLAAVDCGMKTLHDVAAENGRDFEEIVEVRKMELEQLADAGIEVVRSTGTRDFFRHETDLSANTGGNRQQTGHVTDRSDTEQPHSGNESQMSSEYGESNDMGRLEDMERRLQMEFAAKVAELRAAILERENVQLRAAIASSTPSTAQAPISVSPAPLFSALNVSVQEMRIPSDATFSVHAGDVRLEAPEVPAPQITNVVNVLPTPIEVNIPQAAPPNVEITAIPGEMKIEAQVIADVKMPPREPATYSIREQNGQITKIMRE